MPVRRHFFPWDRPLLAQAVEFLAVDWKGQGPLDLSRTQVIVPTQQAGRRLREALADFAGNRGQAVFPPRIATPEIWLAGGLEAAAAPVESLLAWSDVLREIDLGEFREVFPIDPPVRDFGWSLRLAQQFLKVQSELAEGGLRMADVLARAGASLPEVDRWAELGALETLYDKRLRARGRRDVQALKIEAAGRAPAAEAFARIVLLAAPDPLSLVLTGLEAASRRTDVTVGIFAPESEAASFDVWGRPIPEAWARREAPLADFEKSVHLCADPTAQADWTVELVRSYIQPEKMLAVGVADAAVKPALEAALEREGIPAYDPDGRSWRRSELYLLLSALASLGRDPSYDALSVLARSPDILKFLRDRLGPAFSPSHWLEDLDEMRHRHLPPDLDSARARAARESAFAGLAPALDAIAELAAAMNGPVFGAGATSALQAVFAQRRFDPTQPAEEESIEAAREWTSLVVACAAAAPGLAPADGWELALGLFGAGRRAQPKKPGSVEMQGWLELLWEDAPHLAVLGANEGSLPSSIAGDAFLPEALRERLGLRTNAARHARDNYLLAALAASRSKSGRIDLLVGKVSAAGEPMQPSRLLLHCADQELPRRVLALFRPPPPGRPSPPWRRAWTLRPPEGPALQQLSVTAFHDYLRCPFRFYLRRVLHWSSLDVRKSEWDDFEFGSLCHGALEAMGRDPGLRDSTDAALLREFLHASLADSVQARYGGDLSLPILVQLSSAKQRLSRVAEIQADHRREGWVIVETEQPIKLDIGGMNVVGKIDRIERHERHGWRVVDYKTGNKAESPDATHTAGSRAAASAPEFARFSIGGREMAWTDLQLPLYVAQVEQLGRTPVVPAYFNLPKATGDTAIVDWSDYDGEWRAAAWRCAEGVVAAVRAGIFWPPVEIPARRDEEFAGLFQQGAAASVDPGFGGRAHR